MRSLCPHPHPVLVVEPAPLVRDLLACRLRLGGYEPTVLAHLQQAETHLHHAPERYRVILLDVSAAHLSVTHFLHSLTLWFRSRDLCVPALIGLTTGHIPAGVLGLRYLLEKPIDFAYLSLVLHEAETAISLLSSSPEARGDSHSGPTSRLSSMNTCP